MPSTLRKVTFLCCVFVILGCKGKRTIQTTIQGFTPEEEKELAQQTLSKAEETDLVKRILNPDRTERITLEDKLAIVVPPEVYTSEPIWQENDRILKSIGSMVFSALKANDIRMLGCILASKNDIETFKNEHGLESHAPNYREFVESTMEANFAAIRKKIDWKKVSVAQMETEVRKTESGFDILFGSVYIDLIWSQYHNQEEQHYKILEVDDLVLTPNGYRVITIGKWLYLR